MRVVVLTKANVTEMWIQNGTLSGRVLVKKRVKMVFRAINSSRGFVMNMSMAKRARAALMRESDWENLGKSAEE